MNNETLLLSVLRESREYKALTDALGAAKRQASPRPFAVTGLSEGASPLLLCALAGDTVASGERVLILFSSERTQPTPLPFSARRGFPPATIPPAIITSI